METASKCANHACSAVCRHTEGKFFRFDLDVGNAAGELRCRTVYLWLCARCARQMKPRVEVSGDTITLLLASTKRPPLAAGDAIRSGRVN
jgi:hypothetical protein